MSLQRFRQSVAALVVLVSFNFAATPVTAASAPMIASKHISAPEAAKPVGATVSALRREVFGFALASSLADPNVGYSSWNFSLLSTVAFFGLHVNWDGTIVADSGWSVWNSSTVPAMTGTAHAHGTRVLLTLVLQDFQPGTPNMCAGLINRATTVAQAVAQVKAKQVDGLNVDYEGLNGTCQNGQTAQAMLTDFVRQLRAAMPSPAYLSVDTYASSAADTLGFFDVVGLNPYVDSFFVMAYDLEYSNWSRSPTSCASFCLGPTAPLTGYYYNDTTTASQYVGVVGASKVLLGVPYYGRKACVGGVVANAYPMGSVVADTYLDASGEITDPGVTSGSYAVHRDGNDAAGAERWDTWTNASLGCTRELYWDDAVSLGHKYDLVNQDGLRGVGLWNLNYGGSAPELWAALSSHFLGCASVSVGASLFSPQSVGTTISVNAMASGCPNPLYQFWVLPPGGTWQVAQPFSSAASFKWTTSTLAPGVYRFSIWVKDAASSAAYDAYNASLVYTLTYRACTSVGASSSPATQASAGTVVTITGTAATCPNPTYEYWILPPGAGAWQSAQAYSTNGSFQWNTAGKTVGTYRFSVWAKDALGTAAYDAFNAGLYVNVIVPCAAVTVSAVPKSPATSGTSVTVTASATGCPSPVYEFWILSPGSTTWLLAQGYSAANAYRWMNTGDGAGSYRFSVWVKDAASVAAYDAFDASQYFTLTRPCTAVAVAESPAASVAAGTAVTMTGKAAGCSTPQYEFWVLAPGSSTWQLGQAFSASATFQWDTTGKPAGSYRFSVWVKDAASYSSYDAFDAATYVMVVKACGTVAVTASPATSAPVGTAVTITASAASCTNPVYEFWILPPGASTWQLVQGFSPSAAYVWKTTGLPKGVYRFSVWARDSGSASSYDSFNPNEFVTLT